MSIFGKKSDQPEYEALLDQTLYQVPGTNNHITWADSLEGTLITGATGSGKTSAVGRYIGKAMLENGYGMVIFCAKKEERQRWEGYIEETGRSSDKIVFNKDSGLNFNFLKYEMERKGEGSGDILNAINVLMNLNEQSRVFQSGSGGNKDERFWDESLRRLISRSIGLLKLAQEEISVHNMRKIVSDSFREDELETYLNLTKTIASTKEIDKAEREQAQKKLDQWISSNYFVGVIDRLTRNDNFGDEETDLILDYWLKEFARLSERPASIIVESFMGIVEPFMNNGILKAQFSSGLDDEINPETVINSRNIVIVDFPIKEFGLSGVFAATIYKTAFQAACERREISQESDPKPIGLFIDEYQNYCNPISDSLFQATARSSWVASVYITQNIANLYFVMGSNQPQARARSLVGNLNIKYFANNAEITTNEWASKMIGQHWIDVPSYSYDKAGEPSKSVTNQYHYKITPDHFTTLKTGRKENKFKVEVVVFKPGKLWGENDQNFTVVEFNQN